MKITEIQHTCDNFFFNGDATSPENYVIINDHFEVFRNGRIIQLDSKCSLGFPILKVISPEQFILVDAEKPYTSKNEEPNAWIINNSGKVEKELNLGSVHKIVATKNYIICSYTDAQLFTNFKYAQNGLVVFDKNGQSQFEYYRDVDLSKNPRWLENYAFLKKNETTIYYFPFDLSAIVEFSLVDFSSKVLFYLPQINGFPFLPKAFSKKGDDWYFIIPEKEQDNSKVLKLDTKNNLEEIGTCCFSHFPKGMIGGKFFVPFSGGLGSQKKCQFIEV